MATAGADTVVGPTLARLAECAGVVTSADGEYAPYYPLGAETTASVALAAVRGELTGAARRRVSEAVSAARRDLDPGERLAGGELVYGVVERADATRNAVPLELLAGAELRRPVERDQTPTDDDVALDRDSFLYRLRALGDGLPARRRPGGFTRATPDSRRAVRRDTTDRSAVLPPRQPTPTAPAPGAPWPRPLATPQPARAGPSTTRHPSDGVI